MPQSMQPAQRPSLPWLFLEYLFPLIIVIQLVLRGLPPALKYMLLHPLSIPFPSKWHKQILNGGQPFLLAEADRMYAPIKKDIIAQAKGRVLEIGAGTGETVKYYDQSKVDVIYGVEPNLEALPELRKQLVRNKIVEKYEILPFGVEEDDKMAEAGVYPGSIDTIVCMMCLCSIPTPEKLINAMYNLLKPGGTVLVFEHVGSDHPVPHFVQTLYTNGGWRFIMDGCELNRPTGRYLLESGTVAGRKGWKEVELQNAPGEGWWSIVPHLVGKLVKA